MTVPSTITGRRCNLPIQLLEQVRDTIPVQSLACIASAGGAHGHTSLIGLQDARERCSQILQSTPRHHATATRRNDLCCPNSLGHDDRKTTDHGLGDDIAEILRKRGKGQQS